MSDRLDNATVARNRRPRMEQQGDALSDWYQKECILSGKKEADRKLSVLSVQKSRRAYNDPDRIMPGAILKCGEQVFVKAGQISNGKYYTAYGDPTKHLFRAEDCTVLRQNAGLVYVD